MARDDSNKRFQTVAVILMIVAVIQCLVLLATTAYWTQIRKSKLKPFEPELNISKSSLVSHEYSGRGSEVLTALSTLAVNKLYDSDATPETTEFIYTPSGNCVTEQDKPWIKLMNPEVVTGSNMTKIIWYSSKEMSEEEGGALAYTREGGIVIKRNGHYFVTAQLVTDCPVDNDTHIDIPLKISICLWSNNSDNLNCILSNARSKCDHIVKDDTVSTSIGAVFKLMKGERLILTTSKQRELKLQDKDNSYFSVHAV